MQRKKVKSLFEGGKKKGKMLGSTKIFTQLGLDLLAGVQGTTGKLAVTLKLEQQFSGLFL